MGIVLLVTLWFGWQPFNYISPNDFKLDPETKSVQINMRQIADGREIRGIAYTRDSITIAPSGEIEFCLELTPLAESSGLGGIVTIGENAKQPRLMIGQWQEHLVIRIADSRSSKGYREVGVRNQLPINKTQQLSINFTSSAATLFVNGEQKGYFPGFSLAGEKQGVTGRIIIGNNRFGTEPWHGNMERFAISKRKTDGELTPLVRYDFGKRNGVFVKNEVGNLFDLHIPEKFTPLERIFLSPISEKELTRKSTVSDVLWNIFGFIPVAFFFSLVLRGRIHKQWLTIITVTMLAFLLSFLIESVQAYLPTRSSSQLDLLCNSIGGLLGALIVFVFGRNKKSSEWYPTA